MSGAISPKMFMEFAEREWGVKFIDSETGEQPALDLIREQEESVAFDWKAEFDRRQKEADEMYEEMERNGEV